MSPGKSDWMRYRWLERKQRDVYHDPYADECDCSVCFNGLTESDVTPTEAWREVIANQRTLNDRLEKLVKKPAKKQVKVGEFKPKSAGAPFEVPTIDHKPEFETTLQMKARWTVRGEHVHVILFARLPGQIYANAGQMILRTEEFEIFMQENSHWEFEYREDMFGG